MKLVLSARSDTGLRRQANEDRFIAARLADGFRADVLDEVLDSSGIFFMVADGMGGAAAGDIAAEIAVHSALAHVLSRKNESNLENLLSDALKFSHQEITNDVKKNPARRGMGAVATACVLRNESLFFAHAGDTRLYTMEKGYICQKTEDQTLVAELLRKGSITLDQARSHPQRNIVLQALGASEALRPGSGKLTVSSGMSFLLCSDGLYGMVADEDIETILGSKKPASEKTAQLIQAANLKGGVDNITALIVELSD